MIMCGIRISGIKVIAATSEWMNPESHDMNYDPNEFLILREKQLVDQPNIPYISKYFHVSQVGLEQCCIKYAKTFDCEEFATKLRNASKREQTFGNSKKYKALQREFKELCRKKCEELTYSSR